MHTPGWHSWRWRGEMAWRADARVSRLSGNGQRLEAVTWAFTSLIRAETSR